MVVSRDIPLICVRSWRNQREPTHKALSFHARPRLQGKPHTPQAFHRALERYGCYLHTGTVLKRLLVC